MARYLQENRRIRVTTPLGEDELLLTGFHGHEEMSRLFRFELTLLSHNHALTLDKIIGASITVSLALGDDEERYFNGMVISFAQSGGYSSGDDRQETMFSQYTAIVVPKLWLLTQTSDLRIFQEKSAIDIIEQILGDNQVSDYTKKLNNSYTPRTYCVQYRETDFNFISRLMEEEGISYYFEHGEGKHTLVLADDASAHSPCPHQEYVRYQLSSGGVLHDEDLINTLEVRNEIRAGKYSLNDYNFKTPNTRLQVEMDSRQNLGPGEKEFYDYPGLYEKRGGGDALVRVRIQEEEAQVATLNGSGNVRAFVSGATFTLEDYFREEMNNKKYLLLSVSHRAEQAGYQTRGSGAETSYSNTFTCMPADTPFRPRRLTPKPVVEGVQTAVVVGPSGEEIHTDEYGRIKVQFHWDREGHNDQNSSCWMRVGQLWAGPSWGSMFIPRIGQEVIVDFIEGDPDRPIVVGCVYNAHNMPPYQLPGNKTKSTIKSNSSKGGGGFNEIRFEDLKGSEEIYIHGQKDENIVIENDKTQSVGHDESLTVGNDRTKDVGRDETITIGRNITLTVGENRSETVGVDHTEDIGGSMSLTVGNTCTMTVGSSCDVDIGTDHTENVSKNYTLNAKTITLKAEDKLEIKVGSASITVKKSGDIDIKGKNINLKGSGNVILKGSKIGMN